MRVERWPGGAGKKQVVRGYDPVIRVQYLHFSCRQIHVTSFFLAEFSSSNQVDEYQTLIHLKSRCKMQSKKKYWQQMSTGHQDL